MTRETAAQEVERQRDRPATFSEVGRRITESWDFDTGLQEVVEGVRSA